MSDPAGDSGHIHSTNLAAGGLPPSASQLPPYPTQSAPQLPPYSTPSGDVPSGYLLLHTPELRRWSRGAMFSQPPVISIDGQVVGGTFGLNQIAVAAGLHHVEIYSRNLWKYGHASIEVMVPPRALVPVYYGLPGTYFSQRGRIGFVPQGMAPGAKIVLMVILAPMAVFVLFFFLIFFSALIRGIF